MLSVDAFQLNGIAVVVTFPAARPPGTVGAWVSSAVGDAAGDGTTGVGSGGGASPLSTSPESGAAHVAVVMNSRVRPDRRPWASRARSVSRYWVWHVRVENVNRRPWTTATRRPLTNSSTPAPPECGWRHTTETLVGA